jgi:hypothetical protein
MIAIVNWSVRRSVGKKIGKQAVHVLAAFTGQRLLVGQVKVAKNPTRS